MSRLEPVDPDERASVRAGQERVAMEVIVVGAVDEVLVGYDISELYLLDEDGMNPVVVEGSRLTDANYQFPVAVGEVVVAPTYRHDIPTGDALVLRP